MRNTHIFDKIKKSSKSQIISIYYEIKLENNQTLFLSSNNIESTINGITYLPYSGIAIEQIDFNDSGVNQIALNGIFEENGVSKNTNLNGAIFKISVKIDDDFIHFVTYYLVKFTQNSLDFTINLAPETFKYQKSLLKLYSNKCRANFGDNKCKIDITLLVKAYKIADMSSLPIIFCDNLNLENNYFKNGRAYFLDGQGNKSHDYRIKSNIRNNIEIEIFFPLSEEFLLASYIYLSPNCDKKFGTCCKIFNNAVNFRGEPNIPESNYLKS